MTTKEELMEIEKLVEIGWEFASLWGVEFIDYYVDAKEETVEFLFVGHGRFTTVLSFEEVQKDYKVKLRKATK